MGKIAPTAEFDGYWTVYSIRKILGSFRWSVSKALGEPVVGRGEEITGVGPFALV